LSSQILLSGGDKYYSYSGEVFGDVSAPATISMITIDNTGLKDSYVKVLPYYGQPQSGAGNTALGIEIKLDNISIYNSQRVDPDNAREWPPEFFAPRNSKLEIISLNTSQNNTQTRGVNLIGYYV